MMNFKEIFRLEGRMKIAALIAALNIFLALSAFFKDIFLASYLGTTAQADAFLLAFFVLDTVGNNVIGFSLGTSAIPVFTSARIRKGGDFAFRLLLSLLISFLMIMSCIAALLVVNERSLVLFFSGMRSDKLPFFFASAFRIMLPVLVVYPFFYAGNALLQSSDKLTVGISSSIVFNLVFLLSIIFSAFRHVPSETGILIISAAVLAGVIAQAAIVWTALFRYGLISVSSLLSRTGLWLRDVLKYLGLAFRMFLPYALMIFLSQATLFIERYLASGLSEGAVAALNYAYRLSQMPVWIFVSAIGIAVFPVMARLGEEKSGEAEATALLIRSLKYMAAITIPMMVALFALRYPVVTILFKRGAFDENSVKYTCDILSGYSLGILGQSVIVLCLRYYLAIKKITKPLIILLFTFALNIALDMCLIKVIGLSGIGFGSAAASTVCGGLFILDMRSSSKRDKARGF